jgi:hypothetical protein
MLWPLLKKLLNRKMGKAECVQLRIKDDEVVADIQH